MSFYILFCYDMCLYLKWLIGEISWIPFSIYVRISVANDAHPLDKVKWNRTKLLIQLILFDNLELNLRGRIYKPRYTCIVFNNTEYLHFSSNFCNFQVNNMYLLDFLSKSWPSIFFYSIYFTNVPSIANHSHFDSISRWPWANTTLCLTLCVTT